MKKKILMVIVSAFILLSLSSCSVLGDFMGSKNSLGKTNNTAVTIAGAMENYLAQKKIDNHSLHGIELILNSDSNGTVKLYYSVAPAAEAEYSDLYVAEVNSKTGYVERFKKANYSKDGIKPYQLVKETDSFDAASLPIDSGNAFSVGVRAFSTNTDFHYDYVQMLLTSTNGTEKYSIEFISMLNDKIYCCEVDAVSGSVLNSSEKPLE